MSRPRICAVIVDSDLSVVGKAEKFADLFEVRIDLIGDSWPELAARLTKPWIACNRIADEGGRWQRSETERVEELLKAIELGADIVDIELETGGLEEAIAVIKKKAQCLVSSHDLAGTGSIESLREIVHRQLAAGADICKVVTTARKFDDSITVLRLISEFPEVKLVSFAMGALGLVSRILCPLVGGHFTYAAIETGKESAAGQLEISELIKLYEMVPGC